MTYPPHPLLLTVALLGLVGASASAHAGGIALLPDGVLVAGERASVRDAVAAAGFSVLEDEEVQAAIDGAACAHDTVDCLAKIALLAEADAVVSFARRGDDVHVLAVDAGPRMGRASAPAAHVSRAVLEALSSRKDEAHAAVDVAPVDVVPVAPAPEVAPLPSAVEPAPVEPAPVEPAPVAPVEQRAGGWALAGAGLAGAGIVALAAGGYAAVLASDHMQDAEAARFQDDAARAGDAANGQLWLSGGAFALGVGAMAGGAALVFLGGGP